MSDTVRYVLNVVPTGKPRMTQRDKWQKRPAVLRYHDFADRLRYEASRSGFSVPESGLSLEFHIPMPPSWTKKKRAAMDGQPHQQKPDIDNLTKAVMDALLPDDSRIWSLDGQTKRWAAEGKIIATVRGQRAAA